MGDHLCQIIQCPTAIPENKKHKMIKVRKHNIKNIEKFKNLINNYNWKTVYDKNMSAQESYTNFHNGLQSCYNLAFPETFVKQNVTCIQINWETTALKKLKNQLDACYTILEVTKNTECFTMYKELKRKYLAEADKAKKIANGNLIDSSDNIIAAAWRLVRLETGKVKKKIDNECSLTADQFNNTFIENGLFAGVESLMDPTDPVKKEFSVVADFETTTEEEISNIIQSLKNKKTRDIYGMSTSLLKEIKLCIIAHLNYLINRCFKEGVFPKELKKAKVIPVFKKGDKGNANNYRPISILPVLSKVFETIVKDRLLDYLSINKMLSNFQHGYLVGKSTITAITQVMNDILEAFDNREYAQIAFCDLSRAFDSVNHKTLISKVGCYGIQGKEARILQSFLRDRSQQVYWYGKNSSGRDIMQGVPQGSVLGPILFVLYVNDLPRCTISKSICLYVDDTSFINTSMDVNKLFRTTQRVLEEAKEWFNANQLTMNRDKTQILTFYTRQNEIVQNHTAKFLGIIVSKME